MARGDVLTFQEFSYQLGLEQHNFSTDVLKLGIVDATITPVIGQATPTWTDFSANEVSTAGGYPAGGIIIANPTWTQVGNVSTLNGDDIAIVQNIAGFTDAFWGIIYNFTNATEMAISFLEFTGPVSEAAGPIAINWDALGLATLTRTA